MTRRFAFNVLVGALALGTLVGSAVPLALAQVASTLYSFGTAGDGNSPRGALIMDSLGNLYGTTANGGANGYGTVFELTNSGGTYSEKVLYSFTNAAGDGAFPYTGLVVDSAGDLFGTTANGGANGYGTVFELVKSGGSYSEKVLYNFTNTAGDGATPQGLVIDIAGNLFGTTNGGGTDGYGTVFELVNSAGTYNEKLLYTFTGASGDGAYPEGGLIVDAGGNLYGTTIGGSGLANSFGTVFELVNSSGTYYEKLLYNFTNIVANGNAPEAGLIMDASGNLYGTTYAGGPGGGGTVFELTNSSGTWNESLLLAVGKACEGSGMINGYGTQASLVMDASGSLYGTIPSGGTNGAGAIFSIKPGTAHSTTNMTLLSSANPIEAGFPVTFTATVTSTVGYPTGFVSLASSSGQVASEPLICGVATVSLPDALTLGIGTIPITASYTPATADYAATNNAASPLMQAVTEPGVVVTNGSNTLTGNDNISGIVSATSFVGNGAGLTNVAAVTATTATTAITATTATTAGIATNALALGGLPPTSYVMTSSVGVPSGVASLDMSGKVPAAQLPSSTTGSTTPTILTGWCSGVAASANGSTFGFSGLGDPTNNSGTSCSNGTGSSAVIGIPMTSAGTLKNLYVYPGAAGNSGTNITFTVYTAAAPGWTATIGPNQATVSALSFRSASDTVTLTVSNGSNFTAGDQITVSGITGTYNGGTNCTSLAGSLFDGSFTVFSSTATTVVYVDHNLPTNCGRNINGAPASGTVADNTNTTANFVTRTAPAGTALSCMIGAPSSSAAAVCSDTSHAVPVNAGDVISVVAASARTSGTETIGNIRVTLEKQ